MRRVGAVILAAGGSSRLGKAKQLLTFRGETLVRRTVRAASEAGCDPVIVVVGEIGDAIRSELDIRDSRTSSLPALGNLTGTVIIENTEWRKGLGTSIRRGLEQLPGAVDAVVLLACDQPFVDASITGKLIAAWDGTGRSIVASSYANTLGIPALFDRSCFKDLLALPDEAGAKKLIARPGSDVAAVSFEEGAVDIDTPEDFERLK